MKSKSLKWALIFVLVIFICIIWLLLATKTSSQKRAEIYVDDKPVKTISNLYPERVEYTVIESDNGYNKIGWYNGAVWVEEADCENQTCVDFGKLSVKGLSIICAPHRMVIKITDDKSGADITH